MLIPLLVALASSSSPAPVGPSVQVWLSHRQQFPWGVRASVHAQASADGYLLVFLADAAGRVRVLFPRNPAEDQFVRGGQTYELGNAVDDSSGRGTVIAVAARTPFAAERYARADHWDVQALLGDAANVDPTGTLLAAARAMQSGAPVRHTLASYASATRRPAKAWQYAEREPQPNTEPHGQRLAQGKIYYPFAYGYSTGGWSSSGNALGSGNAFGALGSFPYRYDQFYRGPRKVWW